MFKGNDDLANKDYIKLWHRFKKSQTESHIVNELKLAEEHQRDLEMRGKDEEGNLVLSDSSDPGYEQLDPLDPNQKSSILTKEEMD